MTSFLENARIQRAHFDLLFEKLINKGQQKANFVIYSCFSSNNLILIYFFLTFSIFRKQEKKTITFSLNNKMIKYSFHISFSLLCI